MGWKYDAKMAVLIALLVLNPPAEAFSGEEAGCFYCGMYKSKFSHSWVELHYEDGSIVGTCSLHCAAIHMALHMEQTPGKILVGDYKTHKLIDADKACWIIGGNVSGVMTTRAKWAFAKREDANRFVDEYGGEPATFDSAIKAALEDMYRDILWIQGQRRKLREQELSTGRE